MKTARAPITIAGVVTLFAGCTYYNSVYNAGRLYDEAEALRRAGQDSISRVRYLEVIRGTAEAYRARPESEWAGEALFLLGRSRLRLGDLRAAQSALREAVRVSPNASMRNRVLVYLAAVLAEGGNESDAIVNVNEALSGPLQDAVLAEAHLLRGRLLLANDYDDPGWWDLDRAAEVLTEVRVEAGLERLRWGIHYADRDRAGQAASRLLSYAEGGQRMDTIAALMLLASERWGPSVAADLLAATGSSTWDRDARGRIRVERARFLHEAGDAASASEQAWNVARGLGDSAAEARILLARWHLEGTRDLAEAYSVRRILLPAEGHAGVDALLDAVEALDVYTGIGLDEPLGWFAAAEVARDELWADYLARGLFLAYADGAPDDGWAPKALLAALEVSPSEGDRAWLRGRLESHGESPYVLAAYGGPAAGFEALEEELQVRLREITGR